MTAQAGMPANEKEERMEGDKRCPRCDSPAPHLHPAVQFEGEVQPCSHGFHLRITPQNTHKRIAEAQGLASR